MDETIAVVDSFAEAAKYLDSGKPRFLVTATRVCEMVIEADDLKDAAAQAQSMCARDKRRLLSVEPFTETEATALEGH